MTKTSLNRFINPILLSVAIILAGTLYGCNISEDKKNIYDNNDRITQEGDSFSFYNRIGETDIKHMDIKYTGFYGVQTIWSLTVEKEDEIKLDYDSQVESGNFKAVLVTPEKELINFADNSCKGTYKFTAKEGEYSIKIVGRNANGHIKVDLESGENTAISVQD